MKIAKLGHVLNNLHEKVRVSAPLPPVELTQVPVHSRPLCAALALILNLVNVPERSRNVPDVCV